jgi:hypothetical protein
VCDFSQENEALASLELEIVIYLYLMGYLRCLNFKATSSTGLVSIFFDLFSTEKKKISLEFLLLDILSNCVLFPSEMKKLVLLIQIRIGFFHFSQERNSFFL